MRLFCYSKLVCDRTYLERGSTIASFFYIFYQPIMHGYPLKNLISSARPQKTLKGISKLKFSLQILLRGKNY